MGSFDFEWTNRVAWHLFDIDQAEPMVKVGMHFIGELVRHRRNRLKVTQADLGRAVGVHQSVISRLERGRLRGMRFAKFARLVAVLGGLDPNGPIPHWVIVRRGWHRYRDIAVDDPRWFTPEGVGLALERGLVTLRELSGISQPNMQQKDMFDEWIPSRADQDDGAAEAEDDAEAMPPTPT